MDILCNYGCGNIAKHTVTKRNKPCCSDHRNKCKAIRETNSSGLKRAYENGKRTYVLTDEGRKKIIIQKKEDILKDLNESGTYRGNCYLKRLINEFNLLEYKCSECNISEWNSKKISLELDHIDGQAHNCKIDNLRFLCPNCHSQTDTFRGKGINTGKKKVSDDELLQSLKQTNNIRQALIKVGLSPRGGNYSRASKLLLQISTTH
jgi:5-methylcytosine-specific restriction endonuclease McrA